MKLSSVAVAFASDQTRLCTPVATMKLFIKIAAISLLTAAGNSDPVDAAMSETELSAACINEFNDFEECVIEGFINNNSLFQEFVDAYKASGDCFENAADEAAVAICEEPLWVISAQACPSGIDPLIAACDDDETPSTKFGDFALGVFLKDAAFWKDEEKDDFIAKMKIKSLGEQVKVKQCITDKIEENTKATKKWAKSMEKAAMKAAKCVEEEGDDAKLACASDLFDVTEEYCSMKGLRKQSKINSFDFENFVLDLAKELEFNTVAYAYSLRGRGRRY
eukprot:CAMPEP_0201713590 /NCGR_PEP_ID=MMETSP0593-20130828/377_1 /ASSEMBLY_ACC=CAM_ASM_000672 /TAXON_ID=267983 /ORGANISM="Skeletonema japonicum, Strain CCMP2506" /LENGTH=278 /DNA_ID=CAMNT_0048202759 /DNA_START=47 /DNA_END=883 /DNA_ORIENTATION=+